MSSFLSLTKVLRPQAGWYRGDFHTHTNFSDGFYSPPDLLEAARAAGLDFFAITDHNTIAAYPEFGDMTDVLVIPGLEVTLEEAGHFNIFGLADQFDWLAELCVWPDRLHTLTGIYNTPTQLMQQTAAQGLLNSINHPLLPPWAWLDQATHLTHLHCLEIWNDPSWPDNKRANPEAVTLWTELLNAGYRLTAIGGSDFHTPTPKPDQLKPAERLGLPSTYVFADNLSGAAILAGLRQRRAYVSMGPQVSFQARLNGQIYPVGADLGQQTGELAIEATIMAAPSTALARFVNNGRVVLELPIEAEQTRLSYLAQANPTQADWYRLDVWDQNGLALLVANPIFVGPRLKPSRHTYGEFRQL